MKFLDNVTINVIAGKGGDGSSSFRREKFIEFGGPDGGNGGDGGNVIFESKENINTLVDFRYKKTYKAGNGENGRHQQQCGARGKDLVLFVPVGTQVINENGVVLFDFLKPHQRYIVAKGGDGGKGNVNFKTSVNRSPKYAGKGHPGQSFEVRLQLKLIADIGLVGLPNAGKSTFLSTVTNARPKVASYPFTTLNPYLGVYRPSIDKEVIIADIPGLIEGAHEGTGLGDKFLAHIERCKVLLHLVDISDPNCAENYLTIRGELSNYNKDLAAKDEIIVLTKSDVTNEVPEFFLDKPFFLISCFSGEGMDELLNKIAYLSC